MQLIIDTANTTLHVRNKCFYIKNKTIERQISPHRISSIAIKANVNLNSSVIQLAARHQVPILFFDNLGSIQARLWSPYFVNLADMRKKQLLFAMSENATEFVISLMRRKTQEQIINLRRWSKMQTRHEATVNIAIEQIEKIFQQTENATGKKIQEVRNSIMGWEGSISRHYFHAMNLFLPAPFQFTKRSRRPALDYFNAALNYFYGMTYSVVESGIFAKGLDPMIGLLHVDNYTKPTLAFDLIEPIRPLIDRLLMQLVLEHQLSPDHFTPQKPEGFWMGKKGKRIVIGAFNDYMQTKIQIQKSNLRLKDHIYQQSNQLGILINETIELI